VNCLQFDQPTLHGIDFLAKNFGGRMTFWCPVDIQKPLQTKDEKLIRAEAKQLVERLGGFHGGFIAGYYGSNYASASIRRSRTSRARRSWSTASTSSSVLRSDWREEAQFSLVDGAADCIVGGCPGACVRVLGVVRAVPDGPAGDRPPWPDPTEPSLSPPRRSPRR